MGQGSEARRTDERSAMLAVPKEADEQMSPTDTADAKGVGSIDILCGVTSP